MSDDNMFFPGEIRKISIHVYFWIEKKKNKNKKKTVNLI